MFYLPLLTFASGLFWAFELWSERLVFASAAGLHALFAAIALLAARALLARLPGPWPRAARWSWHLGWLAVLILWNLAAAGNYFSRGHWGDPMSLRTMLAMLHQDSVQQAAREMATGTGLLLLPATLLALWLGHLAYRRLSRTPAGDLWRRHVASHPYWPLAACAALAALIAFRHPGIAKEEPLVAFAGGGNDFSDYRGLEQRRAAARLADRRALLDYRVPGRKPTKNVVLILADSLRAESLSAYGYRRETTPFLSRLLADPRTQKAEWAFSTCSESFCGITSTLTGRPYQEVSHGSVKLYDYLAEAGYDTDLILAGDHSHLSDMGTFYGDAARADHGPEASRYGRASDDRGALAYLDRLEKAAGRPRFFFFFLMSSHAGGVRLPEFRRYLPDDANLARARWNNDDAEGMLRSISRPPSYLERVVNNYDNGILQVDHFIEKIFRGLEERGYLEDALVIVSSDHGDSMGEHNHVGHTWRLYDVDIHIPLLIWDSDPSPRPKELPIAAHVSLAPTILDRLGLPIPETLVAPPLDRAPANFASVHLTRRPQQPCAAAIEGTREKLHKLIVCTAGGEPQEELYELIGDPDERRDLLAAGAADPAVVAGLRARLDFFYLDILGRRKPKKD
jgi:glucan phosphoethanolaminetransferase (alkaline phosphatase superfamily)